MVSCGTSGSGGVSKSAMAPTKEATSAFAKATAACTRCSCVDIGIASMSTTFAASLAAGATNEFLKSPRLSGS